MKVDRIELFHVAIPLPKPFYPAWIPGYPQTVNRFNLLRVTTDEGVQGVAAGVAFEQEREGLGSLLGPYLIGLDPVDIPTVRQRIREASFLGWRNYWLEAAFWDIKGKVEGKPVWALLGGKEGGRVNVYASTGEVHPPARRAEEVLELCDMGFKAVKLRVHSFDPAEDVAQVAAVRRAVGDSVTLGVDANQGWRVALIDDAPLWTLERAVDFARACMDLGVAWIEEPLDMHAYDELADLCRQSDVPIAGGEMNGGWHEFKVMLEKGSYDIYQPDATMGGGIGDAARVMETCRERGLGYTPHTWTNGLGFLINLHVYAAGPRTHPIEYPFEPPGWVPEARDGLLVEPIQVSADGTVAVPDAPGLGIEIDDARLARYGEKYFEITSSGLAIKTIRDKGLFTALKLARKKRR
ncbi:MAG: mandelate racemase/muconate lactonizing enzyme family protein [Anaerolineae bacterium]|jgi:L-alanine-DL-glutamate epimerase-like enolase superfamily enzyme|nr:mandelate racemase/muconate lactonizing enzyme family protein [Anaerolineae bacterium]